MCGRSVVEGPPSTKTPLYGYADTVFFTKPACLSCVHAVTGIEYAYRLYLSVLCMKYEFDKVSTETSKEY